MDDAHNRIEDALKAALNTAGIGETETIAVGVSGGADSLGLVIALAKIHPVVAVSVDHGLREQAKEEILFVCETMKKNNIVHHCLTWHSPFSKSNIQAKARKARYALLNDWCVENGVSYLALGHHYDDQAETFLLRLARGSGVYGLAGMKMLAPMPIVGSDIKLFRPLLSLHKKDMESYLTSLDQKWVEDPSNGNENFERVKVRHLLETPPFMGFDAHKMVTTAARLARAADALDYYATKILTKNVRITPEGFALLETKGLFEAPEEVALRVLARIFRHVGGADYSPRLEKLENCYKQMQSADFSGTTLAGCQVLAQETGLIIGREPRAAERAAPLRQEGVWDNRFVVALDGVGRVAALGEDGWSQISRKVSDHQKENVPHAMRLGLPALWKDGNVIAQPHFSFGKGLNAEFFPAHPL